MTTHSIKVLFLLLSILMWMGFLVVTGFQFQQFQNTQSAKVLGVSTVYDTPSEIEVVVPESKVIDIELLEVKPNEVSSNDTPTEQSQLPYTPPVVSEPVPKTETNPEPIIQNPAPEVKEPEKKDEPVENPNGSGGWSNDLECYKANPYSYWDGLECVDPRV